ncbi:cysteine desulfurase family protein [Alkalicoccus halolimnae]|uniref:cysteine desulfurase n=1 Tax=Alkalicoccus halolimnae TaxID=1667239 RepID=A0A5C7F712_9BACI|nr:cysteine desulfurase family protein [Alkalicoccus halolimnae]TXF86501.1 cysteine desulfurase [Alkalicoccus halolimnae]
MERIYLDHAATSPMHPQAAEEMLPFFTEKFGNPSSTHHFGREARAGLDEAREAIARAVGASYNEIIFTGGGTEADNLAIAGFARENRYKGKHVITVITEHHGVLNACSQLEQEGFEVSYLSVSEEGRVSLEQIEQELREDTILVSVMTANNETGTLQPVNEIGALLKEHQAAFHTDAVQALGKCPIDVNDMNVDLLACSAHKFNGPNGTGFLYARKGVELAPILFGGEQERKRRAGTENTAGAAGMKKALEISLTHMEERAELYLTYRNRLKEILSEAGINYYVNGDEKYSLPNVLNLSFPKANVEQLLMNLDLEGIAVSSGSACTAGSVKPSHVLIAMHGENDRSKAAVRFSFGYGNTLDQIEKAGRAVIKVLDRMKVSK